VKKPFRRRTEIFVVRLWAEYLEQSPLAWRGEIEHVGNREVMHFGSLAEVGEQIRRCIRKENAKTQDNKEAQK
jgi:hypothetical protein